MWKWVIIIHYWLKIKNGSHTGGNFFFVYCYQILYVPEISLLSVYREVGAYTVKMFISALIIIIKKYK